MNRNGDILARFLLGLPHRTKKGHWPAWYEMGAGQRYCVNCAQGGSPQRLFLPVPVPLTGP